MLYSVVRKRYRIQILKSLRTKEKVLISLFQLNVERLFKHKKLPTSFKQVAPLANELAFLRKQIFTSIQPRQIGKSTDRLPYNLCLFK